MRVVLVLTLAGAAALLAGAGFYLLARPPTAFTSPFLSLRPATGPVLGDGLGGSLPTFLHALAFSLLTLALVGPTPRRALLVGAAWFSLEALFELAQLPALGAYLVGSLPAASGPGTLAGMTRRFLAAGTFDPADLLAALVGAAAASALAVAMADRPSSERRR